MGTNTGIGIGIGIPFKNNVLGEGKPYLPPEIKDSLKAVVIAYGKTNNDSDRAIVKNLVDPDNPFVISNAAFKLNSGFGGFVEDFTSWDRIDSSTAEISNDGSKIKCINTILNVQYLFNSINKDIPSFKVKISNFTKGNIAYYYRKEDGTEAFLRIEPSPLDKVLELPKSYNTVEGGTGSRGGFYSSNINIGVTIEQIPSFQGAFVTDGIDDLITSTKTVQEMGITDEVTVVSMIHQIDLNSTYTIATTNYIENSNSREHVRSDVYNYGKTGIYGYSASLINNTKSDIKNILGDEADYYVKSTNSLQTIFDAKFSVVGRISELTEASQVAWYWTIIANKVLTTDQINQVIAYFNLDRCVEPTVLYDVKRQGLSNDTPDSDWYLKDYSGNGYDMTLYNYAKTPESGINEDGGLQSDGVEDYGKVTGLPIYKDYTVVADREIIDGLAENADGGVALKGSRYLTGAFCFDYKDAAFSFGTPKMIPLDTKRFISYQSKYVSNGISINIGTATDNDELWIGRLGNDERYSKIAIRFLMSFPYSMSEFLIERQLKKHKLGTLYPNMVEFRPIIKSNIDILKINYWDKDWNVVNVGDYVSVGNAIKTNITVPNGYKVSKVTSDAFDNITIEKSSTDFIYDVKFYGIKKSPQKITMTIEQDENYVKFEPVITSNVEYVRLDFYLNNYQKRINIGDYIPKDAYLRANFYLKNNVDELTVFTFNGVNIGYKRSSVDDTAFNTDYIYNYDSPQEVNITIDEYIRYEDIVQPYPVLLRFNDENGNEVSWGGKFRVGSTITRIGSIADPESNLLNGLYSISGLSLNGKAVTSSTSIVEKQMVFKTTATWLLDNNEPKCILSPRLLRIPNSSYKILGHIPDISGHGNHGKINNSAYAEGSGVNEDGSYQFDGVDDFITIPTITGGKQVLMNVNWQNRTGLLYDQRKNGSSIDAFAILNVNSNNSIAYNSRNTDGETYIDGILNKNIVCPQLYKITHSITIINQLANKEEVISPTIGSDTTHKIYFSQMSLYDFMLFDDISTDDKIKELNEYVGVEAKVELPPYYWDTYGKTNFDEDRATIQQRGIAKGDYDLTNYNHAYNKMSGYGGYKLSTFDKWRINPNNDTIQIVEVNGYRITLKYLGNFNDWHFSNQEIRHTSDAITVRLKSDKDIYFICDYHYREIGNASSEGTPVNLSSAKLLSNEDTTIVIQPISQEKIEQNNIDVSTGYYYIYFRPYITLTAGEEFTVEMLPLYPNGLLYDAVTDYSENVNIPVFTDFTAIMKRKWLKNQGCPLIKGSKVYEGGNGNALLFEWDKAYNFVFYKRTDIMEGEVPDNISFITPTNYNGNVITRGSEQDTNGICIAGDGNAGFANMVFYKLILYPKTIPLLQINFLKNLMERDEIIDLNNPIFIQE